MKIKKIAALFVCLSFVFISSSIALGSEVASKSAMTSIENYYGDYIPSDVQLVGNSLSDNSFGGLYFDENGTLVVNIIGDKPMKLEQTSENDELDIKFQNVIYPLSFLENIASSLIPYMREFKISVLDANDVTNKVDIFLKDFSEKNISAIEAFLGDDISTKDIVNFIDYSDVDLLLNSPMEDSSASDDTTPTNESRAVLPNIYPGLPIQVGSSGLTLGPRKNSTSFYTAGHAASKGSTVTADIAGLKYTIGTISSSTFSGSTDSAVITLNSGFSQDPIFSYVFATPIVGTAVKMVGGESTATSGSITSVNAAIYYEDNDVTLTNMAAGNYSCQLGDSGGPIFNKYTSSLSEIKYCYGMQSGMGVSGGASTGISYFTKSGNLK